MISLDGYIEGENHDLSWHNVDKEFNKFAAKQLEDAGALLFGKNTYELMESYWPHAKPEDEYDGTVAKFMNQLPKYVFSRTLETIVEKDTWQNVHLIPNDPAEPVRKLKEEDGKNMFVFGSNNLCVTLLKEGLLDELRIMISPIAIGSGTVLFAGMQDKLSLQLLHTKVFKNGNVLLTYRPQ